MGHQLPRRSLVLTAAVAPITDTKGPWSIYEIMTMCRRGGVAEMSHAATLRSLAWE
jgi:hypothetical protein